MAVLNFLKWTGSTIQVIYWLGFAAMFSLVIYANSPLPVLDDPLGCLYVFGMATFLGTIWPLAAWFMYMLTVYH